MLHQGNPASRCTPEHDNDTDPQQNGASTPLGPLSSTKQGLILKFQMQESSLRKLSDCFEVPLTGKRESRGPKPKRLKKCSLGPSSPKDTKVRTKNLKKDPTSPIKSENC